MRLGLSREHGKSLRPKVMVNGTEIVVPADFRGDDQKDRDVYFGIIEIEVPLTIVLANNTISITFPENGGHLSSLAMQVFSFDGDVERSGKGDVSGISVSPSTKWLPINGWVQLAEAVYPTLAENKNVSWHSSKPTLAAVSETGMVKAGSLEGIVTIYATTVEGSFTDSCVISIEKIKPGTLAVDNKTKYKTTTYHTNSYIEVSAEFFAGTNEEVTKFKGGVHVLLRHMTSDWKVIKDWSFSDSSTIGTNKGTAKVKVILDGIPPTSELTNGEFYFLFPKFSSSNGDTYSVNGLSKIKIEHDATGINDLIRSDIKVFPNPAKDKLIIEKRNPESYSASIYTVEGVLLMSQDISGVKAVIDISNLTPGNYILKADGQHSNEQIVFQKQ